MSDVFRVCHLLALRANPHLVSKDNVIHCFRCIDLTKDGYDIVQCLICMEKMDIINLQDHAKIHYKQYAIFT